MLIPTEMVTIHDNHPVTTSIKIADYFEKQHKHVLRDIDHLIAECPDDFNQSNFGPVEYIDAKGEKRPMYNVRFDGFMLLSMGFTGKKALQVKLAYIQAFNAMREQLARQQSTPIEYLPPVVVVQKTFMFLVNKIKRFFRLHCSYALMKASELLLCASQLLGAKAKKLARQSGEPIFGKEEREFVDFVKAHTEFFSMPRTAVEMAEIGLPLAKESPRAFAWWLKRNNIRSATRKGSRALEFSVLPLPEHLS